MKDTKYFKYNSNGFTLVETIVALSVLLFSLTGAVTLSSQSLSSIVSSREQMTATYLAQEAVEFVRNKRDENALNNRGWLDGFDGCFNDSKCNIDSRNNTVSVCNNGSCFPLKYDSVSDVYGYTESWKDTNFIREVSFERLSDVEVFITVNVSWKEGLISKNFSVKELLYDWE